MLSTPEALWIIFYKPVKDNELGTMFCVLDGFDECESSTLRFLLPRFVSFLTGKSLATKGMFKLAIISRDLPGLRDCTMRLRLDPDNDEEVVSDIGRFVSVRVQELSRIEGFDEDFRASVQQTLLEGAEGTFLWVGFAMYELSQKQKCSEILEALEDLSPGLPTIYSCILLRIPPKQGEVTRTVLRWVTMAIRPLRLQELAATLCIQADPRMTVEQAVRDAVTLYGPLLKVQSQELHLVHQSARDYLLRKKRDSNVVLEMFRLDSEETHLELTQKCLDYIAQSDLQHRPISLGHSRNFPLLYYATIYWPDHAKNCPTLVPKLFGSYKLFLQNKYPLRNHWWHAYVMNGNVREYPCEPPPLLHIACILEIIP